MRLKFLGTGSSLGIPQLGCNCKVCLSQDHKDKRLRSSVLLSHNDTNILIDIGPDFRYQAIKYNICKLDAVLITHFHRDHVAGIDDLRSLVLAQPEMPKLYLTQESYHEINKIYYYLFSGTSALFNHANAVNIIDKNSSFEVKGIKFIPVELYHGKLKSTGFRFANTAYLTDLNGISSQELLKLSNLEYLILTALQKEQHISQFNLQQALELSRFLRPANTYFTHVGHAMGLVSDLVSAFEPNLNFAYDGLTLQLG